MGTIQYIYNYKLSTKKEELMSYKLRDDAQRPMALCDTNPEFRGI